MSVCNDCCRYYDPFFLKRKLENYVGNWNLRKIKWNIYYIFLTVVSHRTNEFLIRCIKSKLIIIKSVLHGNMSFVGCFCFALMS